MKGAVDPDEFYVFKPTFEQGHRTVLRRSMGSKKIKMVYVEGETRRTTRNVPTDEGRPPPLLHLATRRCSRWRTPRSRSSATIASRPATPAHGHRMGEGRRGREALHRAGAPRDGGLAAGGRTSLETLPRWTAAGRCSPRDAPWARRRPAGRARVIHDLADLGQFKPGEVLVADTTTPDWEPVMKIAGGHRHQPRRPHVPRRHRRPRARHPRRGRRPATRPRRSPDGEVVTVSCAEGDTGRIYQGEVPIHIERIDLVRPRPARHRPSW